jgi:hypothetical protein
MMKLLRVAVHLVPAGMMACAAAHAANLAEVIKREPYKGEVRAQVIVPGEASAQQKVLGTGSAEFVALGNGRSRLVVKANLRRSNDSGFVLEGKDTGAGWKGGSNDLEIAIDRSGAISGGGVENQHRITFGGRATAERFDLTVETEKLATSTGDALPDGTRISFDYQLRRDSARAAQSAGSSSASDGGKNKKTCKRTVWQQRFVGSPGGTFTMIQVPVCVD